MKKKQLLSALIIASMLVASCPAYAFAQTSAADAANTVTILEEETAPTPEDEGNEFGNPSEGADPSNEENPTPPEETDDSTDDTGDSSDDTDDSTDDVDNPDDNTPSDEDPLPTDDPVDDDTSEDPIEEPVEVINYTVTFLLGEEQTEVSVEADPETLEAVLSEEQIPASDASGKSVTRWYTQDLSEAVDPAQLKISGDTTLVAWFAPALISDHTAYMSGYNNDAFGPNDQLTRAQAAQILYNLLQDKAAGPFPSRFSDVSDGDWYYDAVTTIASLGLVDCDGGAYNPNTAITRAEFVSIVARLVATEHIDNPFPDVAEDSPAYDAILTAYANGWVSGDDKGLFKPDSPLTRAQTTAIFNKIMNRSADSEVLKAGNRVRTFRDVRSSDWFYAHVMEATIDHTADLSGTTEKWSDFTKAYQVTFVTGGTSSVSLVYPGESLLWTQIPTKNSSGTTVARWVITGTNTVFDPYASKITSDLSLSPMYSYTLTTSHDPYVSGYENGTFRPNQSLTRAEACHMLYGLLSDKTKGSYATYFSDVPSSAWYYDAVTTLASKNIISATGGAYNPNAAISRGEFVEMISHLTVLKHGTSNFKDVTPSHPHYYAINTVTALGWISGMGNGLFSPDAALTRAQAVSIFNNIMGHTGDSSVELAMDSRYTFSDVSTSHWAYLAIMEAATKHTYTLSGGTEKWTGYSHVNPVYPNWESSASVVNAARIVLNYSSTYSGNYTRNYNIDYSDAAKEAFVNNNRYSSSTDRLVWVSRACQKVYLFTGSQGNWKLDHTFICGTGANSSKTPVGVTRVTYRQTGWFTSGYTVAPVVRFYPNTGYAFHSRLYYAGSTTRLKDASIGYPISHGCVRMLTPDVTYMYNYIPNNTTVVIY